MKAEIEWLDDALASKDVVMAMTHYRVKDNFMTATNGRIIAGHPCKVDGEFLVPGNELKQIFKRLAEEPKVSIKDGKVNLRSGRFSGSLEIMPMEEWVFPELGKPEWVKFPSELLPILKDLRSFISDNAVHRWSLGVAVDKGWCYASNNIILAGAPFPGGKKTQALMPAWVIDFLLERAQGLKSWAVTENYMAFLWTNGAWMRSTLIDDVFPERASEMIRAAPRGTQMINKQYADAVIRVCELSEDYVSVYKDRVEGSSKRSLVREELKTEAPEGGASLWSAKNLCLMMAVANQWSPALWPKPVPFRGTRVSGYIAGRLK